MVVINQVLVPLSNGCYIQNSEFNFFIGSTWASSSFSVEELYICWLNIIDYIGTIVVTARRIKDTFLKHLPLRVGPLL